MIIDSRLVGAICISQKELPYKFWISPMFIHPIYQARDRNCSEGTYFN